MTGLRPWFPHAGGRLLFFVRGMMVQHHPDVATLVAHAAGAASEATALVVACHLAYCRRCRLDMDLAETIGGQLLDEIAPAAIGGQSCTGLAPRLGDAWPHLTERAAIAANSWMPAPLRPYLGGDWRRERWRWFAPGVKRLPLVRADGKGQGGASLIWAEPKRSLPLHGHGGNELTLVLAGSYSDHTGRFAPGDVSEIAETTVHRPVAGPDGDCICLLASDGTFKPAGRFARVLLRWLDARS